MAHIGSEIETLNSEDFGFKKLGQNTVLPSYNEELPFACLQNLDICNYSSLYVASSGNKIVIGRLQELRGYIQSDAQSEISFMWEREVNDVIAVKLILDEKLIYINKRSEVFELDLHKLEEPIEIFKFDSELVHVKFWRNSILLALDSNGHLKGLHLTRKKMETLLEGISAFDLYLDRVYAFFRSFSVKIYELESWDHLSEKLQFSTPMELLNEIKEEYVPISVIALTSEECELVFGIPSSAENSGVSYDHKIFVVRKIDGKIMFQESFDMTPAFGSILRCPIYYIQRLSDLIKSAPRIDILASSCSSEITIWNSEKVVQPLQDSERAVMPVSQVTDNDTNPVGIALDVVTEGAIEQPCPGVDSIEKLPLIYLLDDEGSLQIIGFYHATAIKKGTFDVSALKDSILHEESLSELPFKAFNESYAEYEPKKQEKSLDSFGKLNLGTEDEGRESETMSRTSGANLKPSHASSESSFRKPAFSRSFLGPSDAIQPSFGTSSESAVPTFGKPSFGTPSRSSEPAFGKPTFGMSSESSEPTFGKPSFGTPSKSSALAFGKPSFGMSSESSEPVFGKPSFGTQSESSAPAFGKLSFGTQSESSAPAFGKPAFGTQSESSAPAFGKPSFGQPAFGKMDFEVSSKYTLDKSVLGNPTFGKPTFGKISFDQPPGSTSNGSAAGSVTFGRPSFGSNIIKGFSAFAFSKEKSPSEMSTSGSSFETFARALPKDESPFVSLIKKENNDNKLLSGIEKKQDGGQKIEQSKTESSTSHSVLTEIKTSSRPSTSGSTNSINAVTTPEKSTWGHCVVGSVPGTKKQSPFAAFAKNENLPVFASPSYATNKNRSSFGQSSVAPSSPNKQRFLPLAGDEKSEEDFRYVKEDNASSGKVNSPAHDESFVGSFVEQDMAGSKSSMHSSVTKLKETAAFPSNNLEAKNNQQKDTRSPFAQYTDDLKELSSTGFTLSNVPSLNNKKTSNKFKLEISTREDNKIEYRIPEPCVNEANGREVSENDDESISDESVTSYLDKKAGFDRSNEYPENTPREEDKKKCSSAEFNGVSREESYDTLDDITRGELENAGVNVEETAEFRKIRLEKKEFNSRNDAGTITGVHKSNHESQSSPPTFVEADDTIEKISSSMEANSRPNSIEYIDSNVQPFENEKILLIRQYKPMPLPEYFSGTNVTDIKYSSHEPILRSIEKTYYYVSAEISVLIDNISMLDTFFKDQCMRVPLELDENSITNMCQWRIPDASKLQVILDNKSKPLRTLYDKIKSTNKKASELTEKEVNSLRSKVPLVREEYDNLEKLNHELQKNLGELGYRQSERQSAIRRKMFKTFETIQHIEILLQFLKIYTLQGKQVHDNSYIPRLAKETIDREKLLYEIGRLREDIKHLKMEEDYSLEKKQPANVAKDVQSIEVAQVGLRLNIKRQLGSILKKRRDIET